MRPPQNHKHSIPPQKKIDPMIFRQAGTYRPAIISRVGSGDEMRWDLAGIQNWQGWRFRSVLEGWGQAKSGIWRVRLHVTPESFGGMKLRGREGGLWVIARCWGDGYGVCLLEHEEISGGGDGE